MKKLWILLCGLLLVSALASSVSCASTAATTDTSISTTESTGVPVISTQDAETMIKNNQNNPNFVILDVRTAAEFSSGHLAGAVNIDYYGADFKTNVGQLDKSKQYLVYCRTGIRGAASVQIMLDLGFKQTQNLTGGITQWIADGYAVVQ